MLTASEDRTIRAWDIYSGSSLFSLNAKGGLIYSMAALPNSRLAAACSDNKIRIWDLVDQEMVTTLDGHTGSVASLDVNHTWLVSGSYDTTARLWNLAELENQIAHQRSQKEDISELQSLENVTQSTSIDR